MANNKYKPKVIFKKMRKLYKKIKALSKKADKSVEGSSTSFEQIGPARAGQTQSPPRRHLFG
jgi:hypothetical protein